MTEQELIDAIHQAKLDYLAAIEARDAVARLEAETRSRALKQQLHDFRNPPRVLTLPQAKREKWNAIDGKSQALLLQGYLHDGSTFSMSQTAQMNWVSLHVARSTLTYPVRVSTKDEREHLFNTAGTLSTFYLGGQAFKQGFLASGRALKLQVRAATTVEEVQAIVDSR